MRRAGVRIGLLRFIGLGTMKRRGDPSMRREEEAEIETRRAAFIRGVSGSTGEGPLRGSGSIAKSETTPSSPIGLAGLSRSGEASRLNTLTDVGERDNSCCLLCVASRLELTRRSFLAALSLAISPFPRDERDSLDVLLNDSFELLPQS